MNRITPGKNKAEVWQASVPNDTTVYFPQAVIRNSITGAIIATVNLSSEGFGRYLGTWMVPQVIGLQVDSTLTVYTDSGHTTKDENYQIENRTYEIVLDTSRNFGGGMSVDYNFIQKIVLEAITKAVAEIKVENNPVNLDKLLEKMEMLEQDNTEIFSKFREQENSTFELSKKIAKINKIYNKDIERKIETLSKEVWQAVKSIKDSLVKGTLKIEDKNEEVTKLFSKVYNLLKPKPEIKVIEKKIEKDFTQLAKMLAEIPTTTEVSKLTRMLI